MTTSKTKTTILRAGLTAFAAAVALSAGGAGAADAASKTGSTPQFQQQTTTSGTYEDSSAPTPRSGRWVGASDGSGKTSDARCQQIAANAQSWDDYGTQQAVEGNADEAVDAWNNGESIAGDGNNEGCVIVFM